MKITRVIIDEENKGKSLMCCSIIIDNSLRLTKIKLYENEKGYYLILPSIQDVLQEVQDLNQDKNLEMPKSKSGRKYDEFFFPLEKDFYLSMLDIVVYCYNKYKKTGNEKFRFN